MGDILASTGDSDVPFVLLPEEYQQHLANLAQPEAYSSDNPVAEQQRVAAYRYLPRPMTKIDVMTFGMGIVVKAVESGSDQSDAAKTQLQALRWLGSMSHQHGDTESAKSVLSVLGHEAGIRGKLAARSLRREMSQTDGLTT